MELNSNIQIAGQAAVKALEDSATIKQKLQEETKNRNNALTLFTEELNKKGSLLDMELSSLKDENKTTFDMFQSIIGTHKQDLTEFASIKDVDDLNNRIMKYYEQLENTKSTLIKISKEDGKLQGEALEKLCKRFELALLKSSPKLMPLNPLLL